MTTADERSGDVRETEASDVRSDRGVTVHSTRPDRKVFTEEGNRDGWISTDLSVRLRP